MSVIAPAPAPVPRAPRHDRVLSTDAERPSPSGQALLDGSADLLAAARALAANPDAPHSSVALGPGLACTEALAEAAAGACSETRRTTATDH